MVCSYEWRKSNADWYIKWAWNNGDCQALAEVYALLSAILVLANKWISVYMSANKEQFI